MSLQSKKSMRGAIVLVALGLAAFFSSAKWLAILVPAAMLVWYGIAGPGLAGTRLRNGRN